MKTGDKVKAFVQIGLMKEPKWLRGTLVEEGVVEVNGNRLVLDRSKYLLWEPLEYKDGKCRVLDDFAESTWNELKVLVNDAAAHFLPGEEVKFDEDEKVITVGDVSVSPGTEELKTIVSFREIPVWRVTYWKYIAATRWEPPDADEVDCGYGNAFNAARILIETILKFKRDAYWENLADEEMAKLWRE